MSIFRNMDQPESYDIKQYPAYNNLSTEQRNKVDETFSNTFYANQGRVGIKIAQGIAYATAKQMCESVAAEKPEDMEKPDMKKVPDEHEKDSKGAEGAEEISKKNHTEKGAPANGAKPNADPGDAKEPKEVKEDSDPIISSAASYISRRAAASGFQKMLESVDLEEETTEQLDEAKKKQKGYDFPNDVRAIARERIGIVPGKKVMLPKTKKAVKHKKKFDSD